MPARLSPLEGIVVEVDVILSRTIPTVVAHHSTPHKLMPTLVEIGRAHV